MAVTGLDVHGTGQQYPWLETQLQAILHMPVRQASEFVTRKGAAAKLGMPRSTLESKIRSLKIQKNRFKS